METVTIMENLQKPCELGTNLDSITFRNKRIVVIVPAYNEERFIGSVVLKLLRFPVSVIVVDDGSADETTTIASAAGAMVVRLEQNSGKAAALNAGFTQARALDPDVIVMIDADGQHLPEELPSVIQPILNEEADIAIGSRYISPSGRVPAHRVMGHLLFRLLTGLASGVAVVDTQSGYRAFSPRAFRLVNFHARGFSVESEMQFMAHEHGLRVTEVPITIRYTDPPKRSVFRQGLAVLNGVLRLTGQYRPLLFFGAPGFLLLLMGIAWGVAVINIFSRIHVLPIGYTLISVLLSLLGMTMLSTGVILHSVRGLMLDLFKHEGK